MECNISSRSLKLLENDGSAAAPFRLARVLKSKVFGSPMDQNDDEDNEYIECEGGGVG